ncbi:MAG: redoxin domain-containing protein [Verrucomicrobiota bacterium]
MKRIAAEAYHQRQANDHGFRALFSLTLLTIAFAMGCGKPATTPEEIVEQGKYTGVVNLEGRHVDPFENGSGGPVVLLFLSNDCPISNRYAPEIRRLHEKYSARGVRFWLVHPDPAETAEAIRKHAGDYQLPMALLRDPEHALVKLAEATVTPEAAVFLSNGQRVYHGRIDDRNVDLGKHRPAPTRRDLEAVLEAILAGRTERFPAAPAIGCEIAPLPNAK